MTKTEILEAINATIIPNDKQGITADSLNNILTEIVNAMSEGSGSSGGSGYYIDMTLVNPDDQASIDLTADAMVHNAQLYATLMSVYSAGNMSAVGPVSTIFPDVGFITSNTVMFDTDRITVVYAMPLELTNIMVNAIDPVSGETITTALGAFATVVLVVLPDGSIEFDLPGVM